MNGNDRRTYRIVFLCFFASGFAGLVLQILWLKLLAYVFGATALAATTVLAAFMGGLALGAWLAARWSERISNPLRAYAILEIALGVFALAIPALIDSLTPAYRFLWTRLGDSPALLTFCRFLLVVLLLVVPTTLMGATLPFLAKFFVRTLGEVGDRVGRLYSVNTWGAVLGCVTGGFFLIPHLGLSRTNLIAAGIDIAVGALALVLAGPQARLEMPAAETAREESPVGPHWPTKVVLGAFAVSGAAALALEIAWTRLLSLVLGSSTYSFTVMLAAFLVGLALGGYLSGRRADRLEDPRGALALAYGLGAIFVFLTILLFKALPTAFLVLYGILGGNYSLLMGASFLMAFFVMALPATVLGAVFPLVSRIYTERLQEVGRKVGDAYTLNTLGAIAGAAAAGFWLIPHWGIRGTVVAAALALFACAAAVATTSQTMFAGRRSLAAGGAAGLAALLTWAAPNWSPGLLSAGPAIYAPKYINQASGRPDLAAFAQAIRYFDETSVFYKEGVTTTVYVSQTGGESKTTQLRVNGKVDASDHRDVATQILTGFLPAAFRPQAKDALVIGCGSCTSAGVLAEFPGIERVQLVEIEPAVIEAARFFAHANQDALDSPKLSVAINDARNFLLMEEKRYDVIASEPSNPWISGAAPLFTKDFFELVAMRLRPGGVFAQWLHTYSISREHLTAALATLHEVFPYNYYFGSTAGDLITLNSMSPITIHEAPLQAAIDATGLFAGLQDAFGREGGQYLLAHYACSSQDLPSVIDGSAPIVTDDNAYLEFAAPRDLYLPPAEMKRTVDLIKEGLRERLAKLGARAPIPGLERMGAFISKTLPELAEEYYRAALARGDSAEAYGWFAIPALSRGEPWALPAIEKAITLDPKNNFYKITRALHLAGLGRCGEAAPILEKLLQSASGEPDDTVVLGAAIGRARCYLAEKNPAGAAAVLAGVKERAKAPSDTVRGYLDLWAEAAVQAGDSGRLGEIDEVGQKVFSGEHGQENK